MPSVYHRRPPKVIVIRYSCTTGKAVWLYRGQSDLGMRLAYWTARRKEIALERRWPLMMKRRRERILRLLDECTAALPILGELTKEQRQAIRTLRQIADNAPKYDSSFYNHVRTERRRRKRDQEIRRKMREREAKEQAERETKKQQQENYDNHDYDK